MSDFLRIFRYFADGHYLSKDWENSCGSERVLLCEVAKKAK
jgi:hypothetical protein